MSVKSGLDLLLALLYAKGRTGKTGEQIRDTTRLVKLIFLLIREGGFENLAKDFSFEAYDYGPWAGEIFDGIESLKEIGVLSTRNESPESVEEVADDRALVEEFEGVTIPNLVTIYELTQQGLLIGKKIFESMTTAEQTNTQRIKDEFNSMPLHNLLTYVYTKYPDVTMKSKIRKKILKKSMFGVAPDLPQFTREKEDFRD